jgi:hypothetical protein
VSSADSQCSFLLSHLFLKLLSAAISHNVDVKNVDVALKWRRCEGQTELALPTAVHCFHPGLLLCSQPGAAGPRPDDAALARGVVAFEDDDDAQPLPLDPILEMTQPGLKLAKFLPVFLRFHFLRTVWF